MNLSYLVVLILTLAVRLSNNAPITGPISPAFIEGAEDSLIARSTVNLKQKSLNKLLSFTPEVIPEVLHGLMSRIKDALQNIPFLGNLQGLDPASLLNLIPTLTSALGGLSGGQQQQQP